MLNVNCSSKCATCSWCSLGSTRPLHLRRWRNRRLAPAKLTLTSWNLQAFFFQKWILSWKRETILWFRFFFRDFEICYFSEADVCMYRAHNFEGASLLAEDLLLLHRYCRIGTESVRRIGIPLATAETHPRSFPIFLIFFINAVFLDKLRHQS